LRRMAGRRIRIGTLLLLGALLAGCAGEPEPRPQRVLALFEQPAAERFIDLDASDLQHEELQPLARALASQEKASAVSPAEAERLDRALRRMWDEKYETAPQNWVTIRNEGRHWEVRFASAA